MRKPRIYTEGAFYHVTSRTNDKKRVFECRVGLKTMLLVLRDAKDRFGFRLFNFCIMPTHIHLLIRPGAGGNLTAIMRWVKTHSAKRWNQIHGSTGHLWGERFFARVVKDGADMAYVMRYIDLNPVKAGLAAFVGDFPPSGAWHHARRISTLLDDDEIITRYYAAGRLLIGR